MLEPTALKKNTMNEKILEEIRLLYSQYSGKIYYKLTEEQLKYIDDNTPLLQNGDYKLGTKLKWLLEGITEFPKCKICRQGI